MRKTEMHGNGREQSTPVPPKKTGNKRQRQQPEPEQLTPEQLSERIGLDAVTALDTIRTGSITAYRDVAKAIIHGRERAEAQVGKTSGNEYDEAVKAYYRRFGLDDDHLKPEWKSHCLALCGDDEIWASTATCFETLPIEEQLNLPRHPKRLKEKFNGQLVWFKQFALSQAFPGLRPAGAIPMTAPTRDWWDALRKAETNDDFLTWAVSLPGKEPEDKWAAYATDCNERGAWLVENLDGTWDAFFEARAKAQADQEPADEAQAEDAGANAGDEAEADAGDNAGDMEPEDGAKEVTFLDTDDDDEIADLLYTALPDDRRSVIAIRMLARDERKPEVVADILKEAIIETYGEVSLAKILAAMQDKDAA